MIGEILKMYELVSVLFFVFEMVPVDDASSKLNVLLIHSTCFQFFLKKYVRKLLESVV